MQGARRTRSSWNSLVHQSPPGLEANQATRLKIRWHPGFLEHRQTEDSTEPSLRAVTLWIPQIALSGGTPTKPAESCTTMARRGWTTCGIRRDSIEPSQRTTPYNRAHLLMAGPHG